MRTWMQLVWIGRNTLIEALRQKFVSAIVLIAMLLAASALILRQLDIGVSELRFISDIGFGATVFFGSLLGILTAAQLFFTELENRTALTLLAKPVTRTAFMGGKYGGILFLLAAYTALMLLIVTGLLAWRAEALGDKPGVQTVHYGGLFAAGLLQYLRFAILASLTLFIASFGKSSLFAILTSVGAMLICQMQYLARDHWAALENPLARGLAWLVSRLFPNFQALDAADVLVFQGLDAIGTGAFLGLIIYGALYCALYLGLAILIFRKREF